MIGVTLLFFFLADLCEIGGGYIVRLWLLEKKTIALGALGGGYDKNFGNTVVGDGSGDDNIISGEGGDLNYGDADPEFGGTGSGNDILVSGGENDTNTGNGGRDIFVCGEGE